MTGRLRSRAAVITGAGRGIGAATARLFAVEGAALCLNDRDEEPLLALARELRDAGTSVVTVVADVSDPQSPRGSRRRASPPTGRSTCWSTTRR